MIDSISSAKGTPQNDSLQRWKELTEGLNKECVPFRITGKNAEKAGNVAVAEEMKSKLDSLRNDYRRQSHYLGESMKEGYEVGGSIGIYQRDIHSFDEFPLMTETALPGCCFNCPDFTKVKVDFDIRVAREEIKSGKRKKVKIKK